MGAFSVDRGVGDSNALDRCGEILEQDGAVGIFIEGTRSLDGKLGKAKSGAVIARISIKRLFLPVCDNQTGVAAKPFHKTIISYGELIQPDELGIVEGTGSEYRKASRMVMQRIAEMQEGA